MPTISTSSDWSQAQIEGINSMIKKRKTYAEWERFFQEIFILFEFCCELFSNVCILSLYTDQLNPFKLEVF